MCAVYMHGFKFKIQMFDLFPKTYFDKFED